MSKRAFNLPTVLDASSTLDVDGQRVEFTERGLLPEAVRQKAKDALTSGEPLRMTIRALAGHISKPFAFTSEFLQSLADTAPGSPLFKRIHDGSLLSIIREPQVEGVIESARPIENGLDADIAVHGEEALREMAMGVAPTYSIQWRSGPGSTLTCSACGGTFGAGDDHEHWPGQMLDGKRVDVVFGGRGQLIETTRTYTPAADGTHVRSVQLSDDLLDRAGAWLADNPSAREKLRAILEAPTMSGTAPALAANPQPEPATAQALSDTERAELTRLRGERLADRELLEELQAEKEERTLAARRKYGFGEVSRLRLTMTVDRFTEILSAPTEEGVRELLAATPTKTRVGVPAAGAPPEELDDRLLVDREAMRLHCETIAAKSGETYEAVYMRESNRVRGGGAR